MSKKELNFEKNYNHLEVEKRIVSNWEEYLPSINLEIFNDFLTFPGSKPLNKNRC